MFEFRCAEEQLIERIPSHVIWLGLGRRRRKKILMREGSKLQRKDRYLSETLLQVDSNEKVAVFNIKKTNNLKNLIPNL